MKPNICVLSLATAFIMFLPMGGCTTQLLPKFTGTIPNVTVTVGREASLPCVVENIGDYTVTWMHLDRVMFLTVDDTTITLIPRFRVTREDDNTWTLHIRQVTPADTGYYVCQVNIEPTINQVGYVQVVVPPEFLDEESSPSHVAVQEGNDVRLVCRAKGVPKPSIHWTREDGKSFTTMRGNQVKKIDNEELVLNGVTRKDMGAYLCIATNKVPPSISKRIVLEIHFQPLITVPNQLVGAPIDTTVTLECQVSAFPNAVHFWRFKGQLLINSTRQETQEIKNGYKTTMRLSLRNLRGSDFGTYVCAAKNSLGETESNVRLYEIVVPRGSEDREDEKHDELTLPEHHNDVRPVEPWRRSGNTDLDSDSSGYTLNENNYIRNRSPMTNGGVGGIRGSSSSSSGRAGMSSSTSGISSSSDATYASRTVFRNVLVGVVVVLVQGVLLAATTTSPAPPHGFMASM